MLTQRRRDTMSSLVCFGTGLAFLIGSLRFGGIRAAIPNAGFFPFLGGLALMTLSLILLISTIKKKPELKTGKFFPQPYSWKRLLFLILSLFAYQLTLEYLGFSIANFLFMVLMLRLIEPQKWTMTLMVSFLTTVFSYLLFKSLLKVEFPGLFLRL
jgi:putative tricarboxylic transport membrane protein